MTTTPGASATSTADPRVLHHWVAGTERTGSAVRFTRGKVVTSRWLDPSHGGINLGFPRNV